jgi:hypothetical protein
VTLPVPTGILMPRVQRHPCEYSPWRSTGVGWGARSVLLFHPADRISQSTEVALGGVSRNSSSFKRSHYTVVQRGLDRGQVVARWPVQGRGSSESCSRNRTSRVVPSTCPRCPKNTNKANSWSRSGRLVPRARVWYATLYTSYIQQLNLLSPRPLVLPGLPLSQYLSVSLSLFPSLSSLCLSL